MRLFVILFTFVLLNFHSWGQNTKNAKDVYKPKGGFINEAVPTKIAAAPTKENQLLVDTLIEVSKFETFFIKYCSDVIDKTGTEKKWDSILIKEKKSKIKFASFRFDISNLLSSWKTDQLEKLVHYFKTSPYTEALPNVLLRYVWGLKNNLDLRAKGYAE
jgi:hypothetical protein